MKYNFLVQTLFLYCHTENIGKIKKKSNNPLPQKDQSEGGF